jgi:hypothetical protein
MFLILKNVSPEFIGEFNKNMADPKYRQEVDKAVANVKELINKLLTAAGQPFNAAFSNITDNVIPRLVGSLARTATTAVFNIASAIPGVGAVLSAGKILNNFGQTFENISETVSETSETLHNAVSKMKENLNNLTMITHSVGQRTSNSMENFDNINNINNIKNNVQQNSPLTVGALSGVRSFRRKRGGSKKKSKNKTIKNKNF